jgi:hypothetical protein
MRRAEKTRGSASWMRGLAGVGFALLASVVSAASLDVAGIRWGGASGAHEEQLVASLRRIAGLPALAFGADRMLTLGAVLSPGSQTAREILSEVVEGSMLFVIEDHTDSDAVSFAEIDAGTVVTHHERPQDRLLQWRVRIDFADFGRVHAPPAVRTAFDPGFALLHELLHGLGERDALRADEAGPVEEILNRARVELGLPTRERYFAERVPTPRGQLAARLRFRTLGTVDAAGRTEYLAFHFLRRTRPASACAALGGVAIDRAGPRAAAAAVR